MKEKLISGLEEQIADSCNILNYKIVYFLISKIYGIFKYREVEEISFIKFVVI